MRKISVYIVDEAVLVRQMIADILHMDPVFKVAGVSANGSEALQALPRVQPEIVLLNIMDSQSEGLHTLSILQEKYPDLPVVVLSHRTVDGALASFKALELGAVEFITKTEHPWLLLYADQHLKKRLIPTLKTLAKARRGREDYAVEPKPVADEDMTPALPVEVVVLGGCIGSPLATQQILKSIPADFPVPILVALHMPKIFSREFANMVDRQSSIQVKEAYNGAVLDGGTAWVAPGGYHLTIRKQGIQTALQVHRGPRENKCRPSIDALFRSAAEHFGAGALGVILSGRGSDGVEGARLISQKGGEVIVQSRRSSTLWELPSLVLEAKITTQAFDADRLADAIVHKVYASHAMSLPSLIGDESDRAAAPWNKNIHGHDHGLWNLPS